MLIIQTNKESNNNNILNKKMCQPVITNPPVFVSDYFQFQSDILFLQMQWIIHLGNPENIT